MQVLIIEFLGKFTSTVRLNWKLWLVSIAIAFIRYVLRVDGTTLGGGDEGCFLYLHLWNNIISLLFERWWVLSEFSLLNPTAKSEFNLT